MNYYEAIRLFEIEKGTKINADVVKKKYRTLAKKWHPDVCGDAEQYKKLQEAYEIINRYLDEIKLLTKDGQEQLIIEISDLINIFKLGEVTVNGERITKETLAKNKVFVIIPVNVKVNNMSYNYSFIKVRNVKDEYIVDVMLEDVDLERDLDIQVTVFNKSINAIMDSIRKDFKFNLDYIAQVVVTIQRVSRDNQT